MFECGDCGKAFRAGWKARDNHCDSTGHDPPEFECDTCGLSFDDNYDKSEHMHMSGHVNNGTYYECLLCIELFTDEDDRTHHHVHDHHYCEDCQRQFMNLNNIKQHLNSRIHRGQNIICPWCKTGFTTATGMTHHLESGKCPKASFANRDQVYRFIRSKDPHGVISKKLIGWYGSGHVDYEATDQAWNGRAFECYFCHREFGSLYSLNQHLNSPAHQQPLYHCPNRHCGHDFKTLAAIINHLESECCGAMRFEAVQQKITGLVSGNRLISF
ncbi:hypothetical protein QBC43DRAFT_231628 [Cladorrhinum sp. PSN259]|nr:hypothetical protein QBC43DRAFT_231628 [Cladorrhinum sp. PSN259]